MKEQNFTIQKQSKKFFEKKWVGISLIFLLAFVVYANSLKNKFVYDDKAFVVENKSIRSFKNTPSFFSSADSVASRVLGKDVYRPFLTLSFALDYSLWKLHPKGYHIVNLLFHMLNAILVYFLAALILKNHFGGLLTSLFFVAHPIQTEAVTWISGRANVLFLFFYLLSALAYIKSKYTNFNFYFPISIVLFLFSLLSKEMAASLPLILILYDEYFSQSKKRFICKIKYYLPFFVVSILYLFLRLSILGQISQRVYWGSGPYPTILTMGKVFASYLKLLILPINLCLDHPFQISHSFMESAVLISYTMLILLLIGAFMIHKNSKTISFAIFWFFITLLPVSNILPLKTLMAERFLYLPSIGFSMVLASIFIKLSQMKIRLVSPHLSKVFTIFLSAAILFLYSLRTIERNTVWRNDFTLWQDTIAKVPNSASAHYNFGVYCEEKGLFEQAIIEYRKTIQLNPGHERAHNNLGNFYLKRGWYDTAIKEYKHAFGFSPDFDAVVHYNLGNAYLRKGWVDKAVAQYKKAVKINPNYGEAHNNLGIAYFYRGMYDEAIKKYKQALRLNPKLAEAHYNLGNVYERQKLYSQARTEWESAIEINPNYTLARKKLMAY